MGKRKSDTKHKDRYDNDIDEEDDDDVIEEYPEKETEEVSVSDGRPRKKLVAKRRIGGATTDTTSSSIFSGNSTPFSFLSKPPEPTSSEDKPAGIGVFSGFKGFSAFKPSTPATTAPATTLTTSSSITISKPDKPKDEEKQFSLTNGAKPTVTATSSEFSFLNNSNKTNQSSLFFGSKSNGEHNNKEETTTKTDEEINKTNQLKNGNINETELKFIIELNDLFERYYGPTKRTLPIDALKNDEKLTDHDEKYACLLAELNKHCSKWISKHIEESPHVILTPVFVDYFNYLILLEKQFYPSTFTKKTENLEKLSSLTSPAATTTVKTTFSNLFNGNKGTTFNGSTVNGHKEKEENKLESPSDSDKSKENEDIYETNKKFPSLIKAQTQPFTPISLSSTNTIETNNLKIGSNLTTEKTTSSFFFKSTATETIEKQKEASITTTASPLKFGSSNSVAPSTEPKKDTETTTTTPKSNFFSSFNTSSTNPVFKFGAAASATTSESTKSTSQTEPKSEDSSKKTDTSTDSMTQDKAPTASFKLPSTSFFSAPNAAAASNEDKTKSSETPAQATIFKPFSGFGSSSSTPSIFSSFGSKPTETTATTTTTTPTLSASTAPATPFFSFQSNASANKPAVFGSGTFGAGDSKSIFGGFGSTTTPFGSSSTPFGAAGPAASAEGGEGEEEPYEPPKPESSDIKEEGAVLTKRIKLFYYSEKEKKFCDKGIGNLFIKPINDGESTQLVIRADNKLATILLNVKLSKVFPIAKQGAKDVSYICIPNPEIPNVEKNAPCKFLFRVKTEEDAAELLEKLNEYKK